MVLPQPLGPSGLRGRLSTVLLADYLDVLEGGLLTQSGIHDELMHQGASMPNSTKSRQLYITDQANSLPQVFVENACFNGRGADWVRNLKSDGRGNKGVFYGFMI